MTRVPIATGDAVLVAQTNEADVTRLAASPRGLLVAAGNVGKMLRLDASASSTGWFESAVHDSGTVARWGRLAWVGSKGVVFKTRAGNSARPDATWSDWSEPIADPAKALITSPNARFIQWRAEFAGAASAPPELDSVTVGYLPQNSPPSLRSITVSAQTALPRVPRKASVRAPPRLSPSP